MAASEQPKADPPARDYVCPACKRVFSTIDARRGHLARAHPELVTR